MAIQTAGIVSLAIDGVYYDVASDLQFSTNTTSKEGLIGQSGAQGYKTTFVYPFVSAVFRATSNASVQLFELMTNVTITAVLATGEVLTASNCFVDAVQTVNTAEGTFDAKFMAALIVVV